MMYDMNTPKGMANFVLNQIQASPENFDVEKWASRRITAGEKLDCGTTLCVAGHIVHALGWTINEDGFVFQAYSPVAHDRAENVAAQALGVPDDDHETISALFFDSADESIAVLKRIAGRTS